MNFPGVLRVGGGDHLEGVDSVRTSEIEDIDVIAPDVRKK
jgi:hypothetical protein